MKGTSPTVEESIRLEAYLLSEKAGHPADMETMFWAQAEAIVHGRVAAIAPSGTPKAAAKKAPIKQKASAKKADLPPSRPLEVSAEQTPAKRTKAAGPKADTAVRPAAKRTKAK